MALVAVCTGKAISVNDTSDNVGRVVVMLVFFFSRYGKIQSVKVLAAKENERPGAIIAFMDIKSAAKAHTTDNQLDGVPVVTEYSEPGATGRAAPSQDSKSSAPTGAGTNRKDG